MESFGPLVQVKPTDENARKYLTSLGEKLKGDSFTLNPMSGIEGNFYTTNRKEDLISLCKELIREKTFES